MKKWLTSLGLLLLGVFAIAILGAALDIGDSSDCPNGYGILTADGIWACANFEDIITWTNITVINNISIYNSTIINTTYGIIDQMLGNLNMTNHNITDTSELFVEVIHIGNITDNGTVTMEIRNGVIYFEG